MMEPMNNNHNHDDNNNAREEAEKLEEDASGIVNSITDLINILREEFQVKNPSSTESQQRQQIQEVPQLYSHLEHVGYTKRLKNTMSQRHEQPTNNCSSDDENKNDERASFVNEILLPLIVALTDCYEKLDQLILVVDNQSNNKDSDDSSSKKSERRKRNQKPKPPRGMLSLQNYTDIACLLELLVCTSIVPNLETGVLLPLEDRLKYHIPKSIAGRMPKSCLLWGNDYHNNNNDTDAIRRKELVQSASMITDLILLDRFRPMLLPRHLSDVYAALFQAEQFKEVKFCTDSPNQRQSLQYSRLGLATIANLTTESSMVDPIIQAKAYQTLLLQGTKGPSWVRQRVSPLLTDLACEYLVAIIQVFVPLSSLSSSSGQEESSTASERLGHALAMSSKHRPQKLIPQMLMLLQSIFPVSSSNNIGEISGQSITILQTIWAILKYWPPTTVKNALFKVWEQALLLEAPNTNTTTTQIHETIRQIGGFLAICPPKTGTILQWLLPSHSKIVNSLVRIASMNNESSPKVKIVGDSCDSSTSVQNDARQTLYWLSKAIIEEDGKTVDGPSILAVIWVHALCPSMIWDLQGYKYNVTDSVSTSNQPQLQHVGIIKEDNGFVDFGTIVDQTTARVSAFVEVILQNIVDQEQAEDLNATDVGGGTKDRLAELPSRVFQLLLRIYLLTTTTKRKEETAPCFWDSYQVVAIVLLPLLCEQCSPESLLFGISKDAAGLLNLIKLILASTNSIRDGVGSCTNNLAETTRCPMMFSLEQIQKALQKIPLSRDDRSISSWPFSTDIGGDGSDSNGESLLGLASIVLSLLIAVLELGSKMRSKEEESTLQSLLPTLKPLAEISSTSSSNKALQETEAGLADMSSYAMVLIASRQAPSSENSVEKNEHTTKLDRIKSAISLAEEDLKSTQPPIRAKGIVSLGRLARAHAEIVSKAKTSTTPLVVEIGHDDITTEEDVTAFLVREILRLSVIGLADSESYVYLAAIQTIVAIGDMQPHKAIAIVASSMASGVLRSDDAASVDDVRLSDEQRIKLAEAVMFMIRRRATTDQFVSQIINTMVYGNACSGERISDQKGKGVYDHKQASRIEDETRKYFLETNEELLQQNKKQHWEEQDIRLKTGGPVFESEEADIVRAARVSVVADLVSVSKPSMIASHCRLTVRLAIDILRLDKSRVVRRSASLLGRELFGCLLREREELAKTMYNAVLNSVPPLPFAVAMIRSDLELLISVLGNITSHQGDGINDSATTSRCEEALALYKEAVEDGIVSAAELVRREGESSNNVPTFLRGMTSNNSNVMEINKIETLGI